VGGLCLFLSPILQQDITSAMTLNQQEDSVAAEGACSLAVLNAIQLRAKSQIF